MHGYPELSPAGEDIQAQSEIYRLTALWDEASSRIVTDLCTHGVERFRSLPNALCFFVPTYRTLNCFSKEYPRRQLDWLRHEFPQARKPQLALDQFLSGDVSALADYRVLLTADDPHRFPHLHTFSESIIGEPVGRNVLPFGHRTVDSHHSELLLLRPIA